MGACEGGFLGRTEPCYRLLDCRRRHGRRRGSRQRPSCGAPRGPLLDAPRRGRRAAAPGPHCAFSEQPADPYSRSRLQVALARASAISAAQKQAVNPKAEKAKKTRGTKKAAAPAAEESS